MDGCASTFTYTKLDAIMMAKSNRDVWTMKKVVAGFIAGAVMMVSLQAFGAGVNLIGKKIDGQADLKINGEVVGQTIIVQGKSYAPVREITDGVGGTVTYNKSGGAVEMELSNDPEAIASTTTSNPSNGVSSLEKQNQIAFVKDKIKFKISKIEETEKSIERLNGIIAEYQSKIDKLNPDSVSATSLKTNKNVHELSLDEAQKTLERQKLELADLESQLAALEG